MDVMDDAPSPRACAGLSRLSPHFTGLRLTCMGSQDAGLSRLSRLLVEPNMCSPGRSVELGFTQD